MLGEPLNLCQPNDDSYDWGPCYDWNFSVLRSSVNALMAGGGGGGGGSPTGSAGGDLSGTYPNPSVKRVQPGGVDFSTITTALNGKLSSSAQVPTNLVDLSTITSALAGKLSSSAGVPPGLVDLSTVTSALAGKLANTAGVPNGLVDLSTVTSALAGKAGSFAGISSACASGYHLSTGTYANGVATGGSCVSDTIFTSSVTFQADVQAAGSTATFNASLSLNWQTQGPTITVPLTGNVTSSSWSGAAHRGRYVLILVQDSTGGRTFTWPSNIVWPSQGSAPSLSAAANAQDYFGMVYNASDGKFHVVAEQLNN